MVLSASGAQVCKASSSFKVVQLSNAKRLPAAQCLYAGQAISTDHFLMTRLLSSLPLSKSKHGMDGTARGYVLQRGPTPINRVVGVYSVDTGMHTET